MVRTLLTLMTVAVLGGALAACGSGWPKPEPGPNPKTFNQMDCDNLDFFDKLEAGCPTQEHHGY